jgi:hypothetical protein
VPSKAAFLEKKKKKTNTKEYILDDSIHSMLKNGQTLHKKLMANSTLQLGMQLSGTALT